MKPVVLVAWAVAVPSTVIAALLASTLVLAPASPDPWVAPVIGRLSDGFGWRTSPITHQPEFHTGQDIAAACGSPIVAAHSGIVTFAGADSGFGDLIVIDHGDSVSTAYGHMYTDGVLVRQGETVGTGEEIAEVGDAGISTGCHLHFEVRIAGRPVDPVPFAQKAGIELGR